MLKSQLFPNEKIRILMVVTQGEMGGAQKYVYDLATSLNKEKYEVLVLMGEKNPELKNRLEAADIRVTLLDHLVRSIHPLEDLVATFELRSAIREYKPDILHLNSSKAGVLGSLAGRLAGIHNIVFTSHGFAFLEPYSFVIRKFYFWAEKLATVFRKKIICVSEFDRQAAFESKLGAKEKFITIHNGIDISKPQITNTKFQINSKPVIGTIANLYPTKGIKYLIEAAALLKTMIPDSKFIIQIIGEGRERKNLELRIKNYGLESTIFLLGKLPNASEHLRDFDIFVLPSIKEGFPYTILEAMAAGLPIVATKVGGIPEILIDKKTGLIVAPKNPQALADAIMNLISNPESGSRMGRKAQEIVKNFTISKMVSATEKIYEEVLSRA